MADQKHEILICDKSLKKVDLIVIIIFHGKDYITVNIKET